MSASESTFALTVLGLLLFFTLAFLYGPLGRLSERLRNSVIWVLIFLGVIFAYSQRDVLRQQVMPSRAIDTAEGIQLLRAADGHFYATLRVNGVPVDFVVDTGATQIVLTQQDARRVGIDPEALTYSGFALTANGEVRTARVTLDTLQLGDRVDRNVAASVNGGQMDGSLLGMSYLRQFREISILQDRMILKP